MFFQSLSTTAMEKALSATWQKAQLINTNIANEDTPGYKAKRMDFSAALKSELESAKRAKSGDREQAIKRIENVQPRVYSDTSTIGRADGNNVDLLVEQAEQARVTLQYQALSQKVNGYYSTLKYAISGGR